MANLPSLFNRADGQDGRQGIATPRGVILVADDGRPQQDVTDSAYALALREVVNSPEVERAEQATITKTFVTDYDNAISLLASYGRGTLMVDESGNVTRVLSSKINRESAAHTVLTIVAEGLSFDSPPDEFSFDPVELGIHIIKHPRYFGALNPSATDDASYVAVGDEEISLADIKQSIIRAIQAYMDAPFYPSGDNINGLFQNNIMSQLSGATIDVPIINGGFDPGKPETPAVKWDGVTAHLSTLPDGNYRYFIVSVPSNSPGILLATAAAKEIISKIWRQEEQPYIVGYQLTWSAYYFRPPFVHPGGVLDDPLVGGDDEVPDYFISPAYPPSRLELITDSLPIVNPQCYSTTGSRPTGYSLGSYGSAYKISWLRKSDQIEYQRTWFKLTRTWMGAPVGMWDEQLYSSGDRPSKPSDYVTKFLSLGG